MLLFLGGNFIFIGVLILNRLWIKLLNNCYIGGFFFVELFLFLLFLVIFGGWIFLLNVYVYVNIKIFFRKFGSCVGLCWMYDNVCEGILCLELLINVIVLDDSFLLFLVVFGVLLMVNFFWLLIIFIKLFMMLYRVEMMLRFGVVMCWSLVWVDIKWSFKLILCLNSWRRWLNVFEGNYLKNNNRIFSDFWCLI